MVSVVLVNYRQAALTEAAADLLRRNSSGIALQTIIVDNASGDGSLERLRASCSDCIVLDSGANRGFSAGCNIGIRRALSDGADSVLLINNDTEVERDFLHPLLDAIGDGRTIATPKIVFADEPGRVWYGGGHIDRTRGGFYHETNPVQADESRDVTFASGCCMLFPAAFFKGCGLLDESYFLYYEDAELCLRARSHGYRIRYEPRSTVRHKIGATTGGEESALAAYYGTRNRLEVLRRYGFPLRAFAFVLASRLARLVFSPHRLARLSGIVDFFRGRLSNRIVVDGVFAGRRATGLERFAVETLRALDEIVAPGRIVLSVPCGVKKDALPPFRNISVVRNGFLSGALWEQLTLPLLAWRTGAEILSLTNTVPLLRPGLACLHDVFYIKHAGQFRATFKGKLSRLWHLANYRAIARARKTVFTVSNCSRRQISESLGVEEGRIVVLGNGWEHMRRIVPDYGVFERNPGIVRGRYYLVLGNRSPYKNVAWAMAAARHRPETRLVVAGGMLASAAEKGSAPENVVCTGYVSDGEMKALMENCRALVHPSLDEGFGIPPLEALALGRPAIAARASCIPEIYGEAISYIDRPSDLAAADIEACGTGGKDAIASVLARHTWRNVAGKLLDALDKIETRPTARE